MYYKNIDYNFFRTIWQLVTGLYSTISKDETLSFFIPCLEVISRISLGIFQIPLGIISALVFKHFSSNTHVIPPAFIFQTIFNDSIWNSSDDVIAEEFQR